MEEKLIRKLVTWKIQHSSKRGRLALIRSTLANIPIYMLSLFGLPKFVQGKLERIHREFLLGEGALLRKWHLVNWNQVCLSKEKGGLDIRKLNLMNKALLGKWI